MVWFTIVALVLSLYATFVLQQLWDWFLVPVLNVGPISFWAMFGLELLVKLATEPRDIGDKFDIWERGVKLLEVCVPDGRLQTFRALAKGDMDEDAWWRVGVTSFQSAFYYSFTLAIGWFVHLLI